MDNIALLQTGVATIDAQHRKLDEVMKNFIEHNTAGTLTEEMIDETIASLGDYMVLHFDDEEFLMRSMNYPAEDFERHVKAHEEAKSMWSGISAVIDDSGDARRDIVVEGVDMVHRWFLNHLAAHDRSISYHVKKQRESAPSKTRRIF